VAQWRAVSLCDATESVKKAVSVKRIEVTRSNYWNKATVRRGDDHALLVLSAREWSALPSIFAMAARSASIFSSSSPSPMRRSEAMTSGVATSIASLLQYPSVPVQRPTQTPPVTGQQNFTTRTSQPRSARSERARSMTTTYLGGCKDRRRTTHRKLKAHTWKTWKATPSLPSYATR
jgi:hypothetical protein